MASRRQSSVSTLPYRYGAVLPPPPPRITLSLTHTHTHSLSSSTSLSLSCTFEGGCLVIVHRDAGCRCRRCSQEVCLRRVPRCRTSLRDSSASPPGPCTRSLPRATSALALVSAALKLWRLFCVQGHGYQQETLAQALHRIISTLIVPRFPESSSLSDADGFRRCAAHSLSLSFVLRCSAKCAKLWSWAQRGRARCSPSLTPEFVAHITSDARGLLVTYRHVMCRRRRLYTPSATAVLKSYSATLTALFTHYATASSKVCHWAPSGVGIRGVLRQDTFLCCTCSRCFRCSLLTAG